MATVITKQHDTKIVFKDTPKIDGVPMLPADLVGCTVAFLLKTSDPAISPIKQTATINPDGTFSYAPVGTDVANIGTFRQEWELTFPNTKILTFPNNGYNVVKIIADLG